jgi:EpsI family protein
MNGEKTFRIFRWCAFAFIAAVAVWNFKAMFTFTAAMFNAPIEDMQHGWVVPFFSIYLLWRQRKRIVAEVSGPSFAGLCWVAVCLALAWFGGRGGQSRLEQLSFIGLCWCVPYALWGKGVARLVLFPAAFLFFTIPVSSYIDFFTIHLRIFSSSMATWLLNGLGFEIQRSGTAIFSQAPGGEFNVDVADPCSGIRSLFAMMAISAGYAYLGQKTLFRKWALFACSLPIAMIGNMLRIMSICMAATWFGQDVAMGYYHDYSGYVIFLAGIGLLIALGEFLKKHGIWFERTFLRRFPFLTREDTVDAVGSEGLPKDTVVVNGRGYALVVLAAVLCAVVFGVNRSMPEPSYGEAAFVTPELPRNVGDLAGDGLFFCHNDQCMMTFEESKLLNAKRGADGKYICPSCGQPLYEISLGEQMDLPKDTRIVKRVYRAPDGLTYSVSVVIGGRQRNSIHRAELCLPAQGFAMQGAGTIQLHVLPGQPPFSARRIRAQHTGGQVINLIYWFESGSHRCSSHAERILTDVWDRSIHNRINRWVMIAVNVSTDMKTPESVERLESFLSKFYNHVIHKSGEGK